MELLVEVLLEKLRL